MAANTRPRKGDSDGDGDSTSATAISLTHWKRLCIRQLALQAASGKTVLKEKEGMS